jgi:antirestriction protein ArdC
MKDIYQAVTDRVIAELEQGVTPWIKPWSGEADPLPRNLHSKRHYRGINHLVLTLVAATEGYSTNQWLTFKQALDLGAHVRKGEKATSVVFYQMQSIELEQTDKVVDGETRRIPFLKVFSVFNRDQVDGLGQADSVEPSEIVEADEKAERIMDKSGATIRHGGFQAFYAPKSDLIYLPTKTSFRDAAGYYSTALHELTHWTGHPSRLDRNMKGRFGDSAYALEELIAELSSAFLAAHCRIDGQLQHANYIDSWLKVLHRDKRAIFIAASQAQKAADYLLLQAGLIDPEQEAQQAA